MSVARSWRKRTSSAGEKISLAHDKTVHSMERMEAETSKSRSYTVEDALGALIKEMGGAAAQTGRDLRYTNANGRRKRWDEMKDPSKPTNYLVLRF